MERSYLKKAHMNYNLSLKKKKKKKPILWTEKNLPVHTNVLMKLDVEKICSFYFKNDNSLLEKRRIFS